MRTLAWVMLGFGLGHFVTIGAEEFHRRRYARHGIRARHAICGIQLTSDGFCPMPRGHRGKHRIVVIPAPMGPISAGDEALVRKVRSWQEGRPSA